MSSYQMKKPLIWSLVKHQERFEFLSDERVEHIIINMTSLEQTQGDIW